MPQESHTEAPAIHIEWGIRGYLKDGSGSFWEERCSSRAAAREAKYREEGYGYRVELVTREVSAWATAKV